MKLVNSLTIIQITTVAALLSLGGCGTTAQFRPASEPSSGERARIRVISNSPPVSAVPGSACYGGSERSGVVLGKYFSHSGYRGRSIGMPSFPDKGVDFAEFYAVAGEPIAFIQEDAGASRRCDLKPVIFVPEANKDYELTYIYDALKCYAAVNSLPDRKSVPTLPGAYCK